MKWLMCLSLCLVLCGCTSAPVENNEKDNVVDVKENECKCN